MQYYDDTYLQKYSKLLDYFRNGIIDDTKNISHCLLFWGPDITGQCALALEVARLLNCSSDKNSDCDCLNCRWIKNQTHPAVKVYTRLDFKETDVSLNEDDDSSKGKKNISIEQAKSIIRELSVTSDYHRVYIFCDRDEDGNLLPLNKINFPEATSNALLKTFEEPPLNTTFIFLTNDKSDIISTVVSRAQSFFVPGFCVEESDYLLVESVIKDYWKMDKNQILEFEESLLKLMDENESKQVLIQIQYYILAVIKANMNDKDLFYKLSQDIRYIEEAKRQLSLIPSMNLLSVIENLAFNLLLK